MSRDRWEFGLLGPLDVRRDGRPVALRSGKQRMLLAALLLRANYPVAADDLVDRLWGERPPGGARATLQTHAMRLRNTLGDTGDLVRTVPGGYTVRIDPETLDLTRFNRLCAHAGYAERRDDPEETSRLLTEALALWRGPITEDVGDAAQRLADKRWDAVERRNTAELRLGRHEAWLPELRTLVTEQPLRERFWAQLMLALYRDGQQAQALDVYRRASEVLAEELGVTPNAELRALHQAVLADSADAGTEVPRAEHALVPRCELPPAVDNLAGRAEEVVRLSHGLRADRDTRRVWMISGPGGVGKTSLAVHVAHLVRGSYPDGQLYLDLRGAQGNPVAPAEALDRLLRGLGTPGAAVPVEQEARVAAYRDRLADRRVLVVLDNAADEAQVRPLLPGTATSAAVITGRSVLGGLDGARVLGLGVLSPGDALRMLTEVLGADRVGAEPEEAERIATFCGRLPLALRVAAARLLARPHWRLARLASRLADERRRLDELRFGDLDVRAGLAMSYRGLTERQRAAFRALAGWDAADFPAWVLAPMLGVDVETAQDTADELVDAGLLECVGWDWDGFGQTRYRLHDLTRLFGLDVAERDDGDVGALHALLWRWVELAERADRGLPQRGPRWHGNTADDAVPAVEVSTDPTAWFEAEALSLRTAVEHSARLGLHEVACRLAIAVAGFCDLRARFDDWAIVNRFALEKAAGTGRMEAILLQHRGLLHSRLHRFADAFDDYARAKDIFESIVDSDGAGYAWHGMGWMHEWRGDQAEARDCHRAAMEHFRAAGNRHGQIDVLCSLGAIERRAGAFADAETHLNHARDVATDLADDVGRLSATLELGRVLHARGDLARAIEHIDTCLTEARRIGDPDLVANVRLLLADAYLGLGAKDAARAEIQHAQGFFDEHDDVVGRAWSWRLLSRIAQSTGDVEGALRLAERAVQATRTLALPQEHGRALAQFGRALDAAERADEALAAFDRARELLSRAGFHAEAAVLGSASSDGVDPPSVLPS